MKTITTRHQTQMRHAITFFRGESRCSTIVSLARWNGSPVCDTCGSKAMKKIKDRRAFRCSACGTWVYPSAGTIMEQTRLPLSVWFVAIWCETSGFQTSVDGFARAMNLHTKTAWTVLRKVRAVAMSAQGPDPDISGITIRHDSPPGYKNFLRLLARIVRGNHAKKDAAP